MNEWNKIISTITGNKIIKHHSRISLLPINPLISNKIVNDDIPDKIKKVLNQILSVEDDMAIQNAKKDFKSNINKVLVSIADDKDIIEFCSGYE